MYSKGAAILLGGRGICQITPEANFWCVHTKTDNFVPFLSIYLQNHRSILFGGGGGGGQTISLLLKIDTPLS